MAAHQGITKDAPSFPLFLLVLALTSVRPATCFLPSSSQQSTTAQHSRSHQVVSIGNYYPHAGRQHQVDPSVTRLELTSSDDDDDDAALLQAKLHVLEDVVVKLNGTKYQDQEEILTLQAKLGGLEETLEQQKDQFDEELESKASQVQQDLTTTFQQEITALETEHAEQLRELTDRLIEEAQVEQDALEQRLRQEADAWKAAQESQWQESLEIATAAVTAGETREQVLQMKLDDLEGRYQQEAADYKAELDQLRKEWNLENSRLETEVGRLQSEFTDKKQKRDSETTKLIEQLGDRSRQLEADLARTKEQAQLQRVKFAAQQQKAHAEWEEQREKERKFYTEAMRLLQRENAAMREKQGFWRRLFRFGKRPFQKKATGGSRRFSS